MSMNKDQVKGRIKEVKGSIRQATGRLVGNKKMQAKGKVERIVGGVQADFGDVKEELKDSK